jgi:hydroxymethylpyrimidine/phosphomethylpyrimidine kinase
MPPVLPTAPLIALTIAGFDPSSGAGITADLMVFAAHRLFGTSCITSLTVQSTLGVVDSFPVEASTVTATLDCLQADIPPAGIKIGMLATSQTVAAVADYLERIRHKGFLGPVVLDPVIRSSSGRELLDDRGIDLLRERLLPLVNWVTPNLDELSLLTGMAVSVKADLPSAASDLQAMGRELNVLATAGHLDPPDDYLLTASGEAHWLPGVHIETTSNHGTGCALSSALLCRLVAGDEPYAACVAAKNYVTGGLREARSIGQGRGPLNHLWILEIIQ